MVVVESVVESAVLGVWALLLVIGYFMQLHRTWNKQLLASSPTKFLLHRLGLLGSALLLASSPDSSRVNGIYGNWESRMLLLPPVGVLDVCYR
jgi:hypothetical protein